MLSLTVHFIKIGDWPVVLWKWQPLLVIQLNNWGRRYMQNLGDKFTWSLTLKILIGSFNWLIYRVSQNRKWSLYKLHVNYTLIWIIYLWEWWWKQELWKFKRSERFCFSIICIVYIVYKSCLGENVLLHFHLCSHECSQHETLFLIPSLQPWQEHKNQHHHEIKD